MNKIKKYKEFINEKSLNNNKNNKINRFKDGDKYINTLKKLTDLKNNIKNELIDIDYNEIKYKEDGDFVISFNNKVKKLLSQYYNMCGELEDDEHYYKLIDNIDIGDVDNDFPAVSILGELNRIDINIGIPFFIRGIGLGKKIYKKLIKDFKYISSKGTNDPSIESTIVFKSLAKDNEIYTFVYKDDIICFWNSYEYNKLIKMLKIFYSNYDSNYESKTFFDDDFLKKYNLKESDLFDIIMKK